jgi:hypothetical protein
VTAEIAVRLNPVGRMPNAGQSPGADATLLTELAFRFRRAELREEVDFRQGGVGGGAYNSTHRPIAVSA